MTEKPNSFQRRESKFLIPSNQVEKLTQDVEFLTDKIGLEEEHYPFNYNRTVYFLPQEASFSRFSIRYRDYASGSLDEVGVYSGSEGSLEIKCKEKSKSKVNHKLKISIPFCESLTVAELRLIIEESPISNKKKHWFLDRLNEQGLDDSTVISPSTAVSYQRRRFHRGENVFNIDSDLKYFKVAIIDDKAVLIKTGEDEGVVCELKEQTDDVTMRWQVYRKLVKNKADWAKSKKSNSILATQIENSL